MKYYTFLSTALASILSSVSVAATFDASSDSNTAIYWGQNSAGGSNTQQRLSYYCESSASDIVILAFVTSFFGTGDLPEVNFGSACTGSYFSGTSLLECSTIAADIETCQSLGKKVLLSLGGATGSTAFSGDSEAETFAETLFNVFAGGSSDTRPFGTAVVDGFDLDIESGDGNGYPAFAKKLRALLDADTSKTYYLSAAPQCPCPDAYVSTAIEAASFDFLFVQFYNNYCGLQEYASEGSSWYNYFGTWDTWVKANSYNTNAKVYLGVPAASSAASYGYVSASTVVTISQALQDDYPSRFGGVMMWDASQAWNNVDGSTNFAEAVKSGLEDSASTSTTTSTRTFTQTIYTSTLSQTSTSAPATTSSAAAISVTSSEPTTSTVAADPVTSTSDPTIATSLVTTFVSIKSSSTSTAATSIATLNASGASDPQSAVETISSLSLNAIGLAAEVTSSSRSAPVSTSSSSSSYLFISLPSSRASSKMISLTSASSGSLISTTRALSSSAPSLFSATRSFLSTQSLLLPTSSLTSVTLPSAIISLSHSHSTLINSTGAHSQVVSSISAVSDNSRSSSTAPVALHTFYSNSSSAIPVTSSSTSIASAFADQPSSLFTSEYTSHTHSLSSALASSADHSSVPTTTASSETSSQFHDSFSTSATLATFSAAGTTVTDVVTSSRVITSPSNAPNSNSDSAAGTTVADVVTSTRVITENASSSTASIDRASTSTGVNSISSETQSIVSTHSSTESVVTSTSRDPNATPSTTKTSVLPSTSAYETVVQTQSLSSGSSTLVATFTVVQPAGVSSAAGSFSSQPVRATAASASGAAASALPSSCPVDGGKCSNEGAYQCSGSGFATCLFGNWIIRACAPGTTCRTYGSSIACDWPYTPKQSECEI